MAEELSWAEIKQLFKETDAKFKETDAKFKETDAKFKETDAKFKETDAKFKETDKRIQQAFDLFESQWGRLMESLVEGDVVRILQEKGIKINRTSTRVKGTYEGRSYEFDIIAHNGKEIVVIEVKTTLRTKHVRQHIKKLQQVKTWLSEYHDHNVYGAVAFLRAEENSEDMAEKRGLFVIRATGDSAAIMNAEGFEPRVF